MVVERGGPGPSRRGVNEHRPSHVYVFMGNLLAKPKLLNFVLDHHNTRLAGLSCEGDVGMMRVGDSLRYV